MIKGPETKPELVTLSGARYALYGAGRTRGQAESLADAQTHLLTLAAYADKPEMTYDELVQLIKSAAAQTGTKAGAVSALAIQQLGHAIALDSAEKMVVRQSRFSRLLSALRAAW